MSASFEELRQRLATVNDLSRAIQVLGWDMQTYMPPAGAEARGEQLGTLVRFAHEQLTDPKLGELLEQLRGFEEGHDYDSFEASTVRVARRDHEKAVRVPADLREALMRGASDGYAAWLRAREAVDYSLLLPDLEKNLELRRRYVECFAPYDDPYNVVLDDYEPGMKTSEVATIFETLKGALVPMIQSLSDAEPIDDSCLHGSFDVGVQRRFALDLMKKWGMELESWRLDDTVHPFMTSFGPTDIRLTTRFDEHDLMGLFSCLHEWGHGIYERQVDPAYARGPLAHGTSSAFHESQSRMWENLVGRNLATWKYFYPQLQEAFPSQFGDVSLETFHRAINKVQRSLIRVDADEFTYCLHIILRFELEREMLTGALPLRDLPEAFADKMEQYLGLRPSNVVEGAIQDVHWSDSGFGYFPTYALGNVVSVQLWERAEADVGDLEEQFERGDFAPLREWLGENVHRHGRAFTGQELLQRATGSGMDPAPYLGYLERKLGQLTGATV
jgi:carboxypeptidase Taq